MLQLLPSYQTLAMPTCGLFMSSAVIPVAYSIACEAPWLLGCVIWLLYLFSSGMSGRNDWRAGQGGLGSGSEQIMIIRVDLTKDAHFSTGKVIKCFAP